MTKAEFDKVNLRRVELIYKKYAGGLTDDEAVELADVKERFAAWVQEKYPRDAGKLDEQHERIIALKAKIAASKAAQQV